MPALTPPQPAGLTNPPDVNGPANVVGIPGQQSGQSAVNIQGGVSVPSGWEHPTVKQLNFENPAYTDRKDDWIKMSILYEGGLTIKKQSTQFLIRRPRELQEVYQARVDRFTYHNIIGTCYGWYRAALFKTPPNITMKAADTTGKKIVDSTGKSKDAEQNLQDWYNDFRKDCDKKGTTFVDMLREVFTSLALYGKAYVLIDNPKPDPKLSINNMRDQKNAGVLDTDGKPLPYLITYSPVSVINWGDDKYGNLDWVMIALENQNGTPLNGYGTVDCWYYFDKQNYFRWERQRQKGETTLSTVPPDARADLVAAGKHALSASNEVPLRRFCVPDPLWLSNRAYLPTIDHLNQDNSYAWSLYISNLAMPVVKGAPNFKPQLSEAGFIELPAGAEYSWTEPEGRAFQHSAQRVRELREEIFRAMYLTYQGRQSTATADGASGASKEMDMMPAQEVMNEYGDVLIAGAQVLLDKVAAARGDQVVSDVRGMNFGKNATLEDIEKVAAIRDLGIQSDTFDKEIQKGAVPNALPDANPETLTTILDEIDKAPSQQEIEDQQRQQSMQTFKQQIDATVKAGGNPPALPKPKRMPADALLK